MSTPLTSTRATSDEVQQSVAEPTLLLPKRQLAKQTVPSHPMTTRAKAGVFKPKSFLVYAVPFTVKKALADPKWLEAMQAEYTALTNNHTWTLVKPPANSNIIGCKWVF